MKSQFRILWLKWLKLKNTYHFYWAHKPLCHQYHGETIKIFSKIHLCRSCTVLWGCLIITSLILFWGNQRLSTYLHWELVFCSISIPLVLASQPKIYKKWPRWGRDILRGLAGIVGAMLIWILISINTTFGLVATTLSIAFWVFYYSQRKVQKLSACQKCSEYQKDSSHVCSGYKIQHQGLLNFESEASEFITHTTTMPNCLKNRLNR